jgi:hypothetical protein
LVAALARPIPPMLVAATTAATLAVTSVFFIGIYLLYDLNRLLQIACI